MVKQSKPFSKKIGLVTEPIVALKRTIKIKPNQKEKIKQKSFSVHMKIKYREAFFVMEQQGSKHMPVYSISC